MTGGCSETYEDGKRTGAYLFYKEGIEALNEAAAKSEKGAQETTTYECVADFLLAVYRKVMKTDGGANPKGATEK